MSLGKMWGESWGIRILGRVMGWLRACVEYVECAECVSLGGGVLRYVVGRLWSICGVCVGVMV